MSLNETNTFDAAAVLRIVAEAGALLEAAQAGEERAPRAARAPVDGRPPVVYSSEERAEAMHDFDALAAVDALTTLMGQVQEFLDRRQEELYWKAVEVYYQAVELARDPEHAHLAAHVENIREAHLRQYGRPIPPRRVTPEVERRRPGG